MVSYNTIAATAVLAVCIYYGLAWQMFGKDRKPSVIVPLYDPPRNLSPAMIRYVWKKRFDDRTFWAGLLSLVAKGLATLHSEQGVAQVRATHTANQVYGLPQEEEMLLETLVRTHTRKGASISMLDPKTALAATNMADSLRRAAVGNFFKENRGFVTAGVLLSGIALCLVAGPHRAEQWGVLLLGLTVMAPAGFYLFFLLLRAWDWYRAAQGKVDPTVLRRAGMLVVMILPCVAAIALGAVVLGLTFGWPFLLVTLFMTVLNVLFLQWMKAPTPEGGQLTAEIEGFRLFLRSVERFPMQRPEPPGEHAGLYEKYLPYAVAL